MKRSIWLTMTVLALALSVAGSGAAQSLQEQEAAALKKELEALKAGQAAIQKDVAEIKQLLQLRALQQQAAQPTQPPQEPLVAVAGAPAKGDPAARLTIIEFTDYQCPFCSRYVRDTFAQIEDAYVRTGKVRYIMRSFPIEAIHPLAFKAHEAAECATEQGKFWEMHGRLFDNQQALGAAELPQHAQAIGLDAARFQSCLESGRTATRIRQDMTEARTIGVNGTPMFFLGLTEPGDGKVKALRVLRGAQNFMRFQEAIDGLLASAK